MNSTGFTAADMSTAAASAHNTGYQAGYADAVKAVEAGKNAAAQEAVGWQFWHNGEWRFGSPDHVVKDHRKNTEAAGIPVRDVYAAPVAAVPVDEMDTGDLIKDPLYLALDALYQRGWTDLHQKRKNDPRGTLEWSSVLDLFRAERALANTPAAPGIDAATLVAAEDFISRHSYAWNGEGTHPNTIITGLRTLIDASQHERATKKKHDGPCWRQSHADCGC